MQNAVYPISALENKFDPENTTGMPVVKFIFRLEHRRNFHSVTTCRQAVKELKKTQIFDLCGQKAPLLQYGVVILLN